MTPNLPSEILQQIFHNLDSRDALRIFDSPYDGLARRRRPPINFKEDKATWERARLSYRYLRACTLVNREWCGSAMPILWNRPFFHRDNGDCGKTTVLQIYLSFLDDDERRQLRESGFDPPVRLQRPMFDYMSFLRHLDYWEMVMAVRMWRESEKTKDVIRLLLRSFGRHGVKMVTLLIPVDRYNRESHPTSVLAEPEFGPLLAPLRFLLIKGLPNAHLLFSALAEACIHLEYISVSDLWKRTKEKTDTLRNTVVMLSKLIKEQKQLSTLLLKDTMCLIEPALKTQAENLRHVRLQGTDFRYVGRLEGLPACQNLERLELIEYKNLTDVMVEPLVTGFFPSLREVFASCHVDSQLPSCEPLDCWVLSINRRCWDSALR